jgi:hypothetical protein
MWELVQVNLRACGAPARIQVPARSVAEAVAAGVERPDRDVGLGAGQVAIEHAVQAGVFTDVLGAVAGADVRVDTRWGSVKSEYSTSSPSRL